MEVGLFTLDRQPHPVAAAFKELVERYGDLPLLEEFPVGQMQPTGEPWVVKKKLAAAERGDSGRSGGGKWGDG